MSRFINSELDSDSDSDSEAVSKSDTELMDYDQLYFFYSKMVTF